MMVKIGKCWFKAEEIRSLVPDAHGKLLVEGANDVTTVVYSSVKEACNVADDVAKALNDGVHEEKEG